MILYVRHISIIMISTVLQHSVMKTMGFAAGIVLIISCGSKPEVVQRAEATSQAKPVKALEEATTEVHEVVVMDLLHAEKYTYLDVTEDDNRFWIAIPRKEVEVGQTYYYVGGLKKTNFKSEEYDRTFETIYLVGDVRKEPIFSGNASVPEALDRDGSDNRRDRDHDTAINTPDDGITLEELFTNREKYDGQTVKVRGKCVKINKAIMGRNWVHIQDGTGGDKPYDLTATTSDDIPVGTVVTLEGKIVLNKDFGAGYFYDIIMEDAHTHSN